MGPKTEQAGDGRSASLPSRPYLLIRGLFASSSDIGKVLDDLLCVLSLASTRFSTAGGKREQYVKHEKGNGRGKVEQQKVQAEHGHISLFRWDR